MADCTNCKGEGTSGALICAQCAGTGNELAGRLVRERDEARADRDREHAARVAAEATLEEWQDATGLCAGGDPGGVTPKMLTEFIGAIGDIWSAAERLLSHEVESGDTRSHVDSARLLSLKEAVDRVNERWPEQ